MNLTSASLLASNGEAATGSPIASLIPFLLVGAAFYFLIIRPQRKRQADQQAMLRRIGVGDEIVTIGGFHGTVMAIADDTMQVELAPGVIVTMARTAISRAVGTPTGGIHDDDDAALDDFDDDTTSDDAAYDDASYDDEVDGGSGTTDR